MTPGPIMVCARCGSGAGLYEPGTVYAWRGVVVTLADGRPAALPDEHGGVDEDCFIGTGGWACVCGHRARELSDLVAPAPVAPAVAG